MTLQQNQLWKQGDLYIRLVHIERLHVEYKTMKDPITKEGTRSRCTKKEFCRLIKGAALMPPSTRAGRDDTPSASPVESEADTESLPNASEEERRLPAQIAAYIWPSYHFEPRMAHVWTEGDGEWQTVRHARPKFPGHPQPRIPLLGYQDEASPDVMRQHIALARAHGIGVFIMDWYWYEEKPFLERQLNDGLLPALDGSEQRFYLMWANHDANSLWDPRTDAQDLYWRAAMDRPAFERMAERLIDKYLTHPNYYRIDDRPVLCIYLLPTLVGGLGGLAATREALDWLRARCTAAGLAGLHLQAIQMNGVRVRDPGGAPDDQGVPVADAIRRLGFDSVTHYQFVHEAGDSGDYEAWAAKATARWDEYARQYPAYFPHVSAGWDTNPRLVSRRNLVTGATPARFEAVLRQAKRFTDDHPGQKPLVTINSWNEWTEASYLLPDQEFGYGYLEAVRNVFGALPGR